MTMHEEDKKDQDAAGEVTPPGAHEPENNTDPGDQPIPEN